MMKIEVQKCERETRSFKDESFKQERSDWPRGIETEQMLEAEKLVGNGIDI